MVKEQIDIGIFTGLSAWLMGRVAMVTCRVPGRAV